MKPLPALARRGLRFLHSRDRIIKYDQRTVVATCGLKVKTGDTVYSGLIPNVMRSDLTCSGCRAILRERERDEKTFDEWETRKEPS
jgi:hypothetical protein